MKKKMLWLLPLLALALVSLACSAVTGGQQNDPPADLEFEATVPVPGETIPTEPDPEEALEPTVEMTEEEPLEEIEPTEAQDEPGAGTTESAVQTDFPLPPDVQNLMEIGGNTINFQTSMTLAEALDFYRQALTEQGLTEREILTVVSESTFSIVFDGSENGQALVVQGVALDSTSTNINLRYEDI